MTRTLRTLILEDDRDDAEQMVRELHREGFDVDWLRVDSEQEYLKRLEWNPEVILADYTLPGFNAIDALHLLQKSQLQIPFIIVSGSIGEDRAVVAMREGVTDYLLKDRLGRLGSAVTQALEKRQLELEAKQAEEALRLSQARKSAILESAIDAVVSVDCEGRVVEFNPAAERIFGYGRRDVVGQRMEELIVPQRLREKYNQCLARYLATGRSSILGSIVELTAMKADGSEFPCEIAIARVPVDGPPAFSGYIRDITKRKRSEEDLRERGHLAALGAEVGLALTRGKSLRELLRSCAESMVRHLNAAFACIWTLNETEGLLELQASEGIYTHLDGPHSRVAVGNDTIGIIAKERKPHVTNDVLTDARIGDKEWAQREGMVAFAGYPLLIEDRLVGVMAMFARQRITDLTQEAIGSVANEIALGIERKRAYQALLESNQVLQGLIQASPLAVISLDSKGKVKSWNPAAERLFGWTAAEILGTFTPIRGVEVPNLLEYPSMETDSGIELQQRCKDGHLLDLNMWTETVRNPAGEAVGSVQIFADITQRKLAEKNLQEAKKAAEVANQLKSRFLANMSHEVRTPLTAILGYADLLKARLAKDPEGLEELKVIETSSQNLMELINDVLDLSKIEAERLEIVHVPCSPLQIVDQILSVMQLPALMKKISLEKDIGASVPETILSDPVRLRQALTNLIGNAIKFTETGSVVISIRVVEVEGSKQLEFHVRDTGIGIPEDKLHCLFKPFTQVDSSASRKYGGTGLGLSISLKLAELLGGTLTVESESNLGSDFNLSIPCLTSERVSATGYLDAPDAESKGGKEEKVTELRGRILLVEDDKVNRSLFRRYIEEAGGTVDVAEDGAIALQKCSEGSFDLIVMDIQMPLLDGFRTLACLRRDGLNIPVVAVTAHALKGDRERCLNAGFAGYLSKPVKRGDFVRCLSAFLKSDCERPHSRHALEK